MLLTALLAALLSPQSASAAGKNLFLPRLVASSFVRALLVGRVKTAAPLCAPRVNFDGKWVEGEKPLREALQRLVARARRSRLRLRSVQVLTHAEMVRRYGPPPPRLAKVVKRKDVFALARFDRMGLVMGLQRQGRLYRIKFLSD